ncbi:nuclear receptor coactivator 7 isoform X1 [Salmo salar]|uniref:Nuclear receptor coactivator 7 isoform X1 n=1 Tax=Salmo salar TaxID=8030 RepID=A0A1S3NH65_SALSA|nr:nuclear receptor coactivator 7 isoform X1 [Salmo salar]|eukprot:XP_014014516.1 PREDICTED: nuclear receptor coactivator 7-like isoform X2 [Salmo salar]
MGVNYSFEEVEQTHTKDNNTRHHKHPRCLVVEKYKLAVLCCCAAKNWEIITGKDSVKRRRSVCSSEEGNRSEDEEPEDILPVLRNHSQLLNDQHLESLANHLPARTQGYPWNLVYSTAIHGTSLKTLYRQMAHIDSPVLLVIKDMEKKVFGAFSSHPFRVSDCCYGTGETFVYSFGPAFKAYRWSGENSYFIRGHMDSLQIGGGGGLFGLWLDADLYYGASFPCHTFNNQPLSTQQDFTVQDLEVWTVQ